MRRVWCTIGVMKIALQKVERNIMGVAEDVIYELIAVRDLSKSAVQIAILDDKSCTPQKWCSATITVVPEAAELIRGGEIVDYRYSGARSVMGNG